MIKDFTHKGLGMFFIKNERRLLDSKQIKRIERILDAIDNAKHIEELNIPGFNLHKLSGDKKNLWSIRVTGNWRITFRFEKGNAFDVNLEDYH